MELPQHFLIIDDDPANNLLCKLAIQRYIPNANVVMHTEPETGIKYIASTYSQTPVPTILFLDINMPTLTGWDVLREFEKIPELVVPNFTIYILSSSVDPADKQRAASNPLVTGYLEKPLNKTILEQLFGQI